MIVKPSQIDPQRAEAAAVALDAYELRGRLDEAEPQHRSDPEQGRFLLGELLADAMHYAAQIGLDVEQELSWVRHAIAYDNGEPVHLLTGTVDDGTHRGWVTELHFHAPGEQRYAVQFLGEPAPRIVDGADLSGADFPGVGMWPDRLPTVEGALQLLVAVEARIEVMRESKQRPFQRDHDDRSAVLHVVLPWGRVSEAELLDGLRPRIDEAKESLKAATDGSPMELAGLDFPLPGIPATPPPPGRWNPPKDPPAPGPRNTR